MKSSAKAARHPRVKVVKNQLPSGKNANGPADQPWLIRMLRRAKRNREKASTKKASDGESKTEPARPSSVEVATLAALIAINHRIYRRREQKEPKDFISAAYALISEAERALPFQKISGWMNKKAKASATTEDMLTRVYTWNEVCTVQSGDTRGFSSLARYVIGAEKRGTRSKLENEFGSVLFNHRDLINRPAGISMLGSIGSNRGMRNAIKRLWPVDAAAIIERKVLSLFEINVILLDQLRIYRGHIPKVRVLKSNSV